MAGNIVVESFLKVLNTYEVSYNESADVIEADEIPKISSSLCATPPTNYKPSEKSKQLERTVMIINDYFSQSKAKSSKQTKKGNSPKQTYQSESAKKASSKSEEKKSKMIHKTKIAITIICNMSGILYFIAYQLSFPPKLFLHIS